MKKRQSKFRVILPMLLLSQLFATVLLFEVNVASAQIAPAPIETASYSITLRVRTYLIAGMPVKTNQVVGNASLSSLGLTTPVQIKSLQLFLRPTNLAAQSYAFPMENFMSSCQYYTTITSLSVTCTLANVDAAVAFARDWTVLGQIIYRK